MDILGKEKWHRDFDMKYKNVFDLINCGVNKVKPVFHMASPVLDIRLYGVKKESDNLQIDYDNKYCIKRGLQKLIKIFICA